MRSKRYALILIAAAVLLALGVVGANLLIDPWGVFGLTHSPRSPLHVNDRYERYRAYQAAPDSYDALLLSSSRGRFLPHDELSRLSGGLNYASYAVFNGRLQDHADVLEFVLRDKASRNQRLKAVLLLIDIDSFGERLPRPDALQLLQPPAISGDASGRFWWKNLTAIQFSAWRRALRGTAAGGALRNVWTTAAFAAPAPGRAGSEAGPASPALPDRVTERPRYADDLRNWSRIAAHCRSNAISLIAIISPVAHEKLVAHDLADRDKAVDQLSQIAPVWDFGGANEPSDRPALWIDKVHFEPRVGAMMIARVFGAKVAAEWERFGRLRGGPS